MDQILVKIHEINNNDLQQGIQDPVGGRGWPWVAKIHTHPMEGQWKFLVGGGVLRAKILEEMYEDKLEFLGGGGGCKTEKPSMGRLFLHSSKKWEFHTISWHLELNSHIQKEAS